MYLRPFGNLHKILTPPKHPTKPQEDNFDQWMFEIRPLAGGPGNRLQFLHKGTRHRCHSWSSFFPDLRAALSILTSSFYKDPSASTVGTTSLQPRLLPHGSAAGPALGNPNATGSRRRRKDNPASG